MANLIQIFSANSFSAWFARLWRSSILIAGASTIVRVGVHFFVLPAVLIYLSPAEQAMWWVLLALGNFANLADFGFGQAISRVYSFLWAGADRFEAEGLPGIAERKEPNYSKIRTLNCTVKYLYSRLSLIAFFLLAIGGTIMVFKPINEFSNPGTLWAVWGLFLIAVSFNFGSSHWLLGCQGINRVREMHLAYVYGGLVYLVIAVVMLRGRFGLVALVTATMARGIVIWFAGRRAFRRAVPQHKDELQAPDFSMLRALWPNAKKFGILSIGGYLLANGSVLLSRCFLGVEITASVGLTNQIGNFLVNFASLWLNVKWPEITILRTQGRLEDMARLFARRLTLVLVSYLLFAAAVVCLGDVLLEWKRTSTRLLPMPYLIFYFVYLGQQLFYVQFGSLTFTENVNPFFKIGLLTGVAVFVFSAITTPRFGLWGLLLAPFIVELSYSCWFTVWRGFQGQPLSPERFWRAALWRL